MNGIVEDSTSGILVMARLRIADFVCGLDRCALIGKEQQPGTECDPENYEAREDCRCHGRWTWPASQETPQVCAN